jgi:hypothetical protein
VDARAFAFLGWVACLGTAAADCTPARRPAQARTVRRFRASEAYQAVAVDARFFYAIGNTIIGKYDKTSGRRVDGWRDETDNRISHLNSGVVLGPALYCANSNYPATPMVSSIEVFDTDTMTHIRSFPLPSGIGSATWVDYGDGSWWVLFANYSGRGGEAGKGSQSTRLVQFSDDWLQRAAWSFPAGVVARWEAMSSSGGALTAGRVFVTTGHRSPELYVLSVPPAGRELQLRGIVAVESEGQGIALDRTNGLLYSVQRRTREVLVSVMPSIAREPGR